MLMQAPPGGGDFTGNSGFSYVAKDGEHVQIGDGDVAMAIRLNWSQVDLNHPHAPVEPAVEDEPPSKIVSIGKKSF